MENRSLVARGSYWGERLATPRSTGGIWGWRYWNSNISCEDGYAIINTFVKTHRSVH